METKKEPKTLEEANYHEREIPRCNWCDYASDVDERLGLCRCMLFEQTVSFDGVCDCYE